MGKVTPMGWDRNAAIKLSEIPMEMIALQDKRKKLLNASWISKTIGFLSLLKETAFFCTFFVNDRSVPKNPLMPQSKSSLKGNSLKGSNLSWLPSPKGFITQVICA